MESVAYLIVWIWAVSTIGVSLYNLGRAYFALSPVIIHFTCEEKFEWYDGLSLNRAIIIAFYSSLSLLIALTYGVSIIKSNDLFGIVVNLFLNIIIQIGLVSIIENKMPYNTIQTFKNSINKSFYYYPLSKFQEKKTSVVDKTFEILDIIKRTTISSEKKIESLAQKCLSIEIPFVPKVGNAVNAQDLVKKFKIAPRSLKDVELIIKGKEPKQPIVFTQLHSGKINKKIIFTFFRENFELIDNETKEWKSGQNEILEFINKYSTFQTQDKDYLELNKENFRLTADILSRYKSVV